VSGNAPMFVFGCAAVWFGMINAVRELVKERTVWRREELAGANIAAYLSSKIVVLGTLAAIQSVSSLAVLDATIGYRTTARSVLHFSEWPSRCCWLTSPAWHWDYWFLQWRRPRIEP